MDALKIPVPEWQTVLEYNIDDKRSCRGSQKVTDDEIHVFWEDRYKGKSIHSVSTSRYTEDEAKLFFYNELRNKLGGSWLIMRTLVEKEAEVFHKQMKALEQQIPAAVLAKYQEILGPLENVTQEVIDEATVDLQIICDNWHK